MKDYERHTTKSVTTYQCGCGCKTDCGCKKKKKTCGCKKPCGCEPEVKGCDEYVKIECIIDKDSKFLGEILSQMQEDIVGLQKNNLALTQQLSECCEQTSTNTPVPNQICVEGNQVILKADGQEISSDTLPTGTTVAAYTICENLGNIALKQDGDVVSTLPLELVFAGGKLFLTSDGEEIANVEIPTADIQGSLNLECNTVGANNYLQLTYNGVPIGTQDLAGNEGIQFISMFQKLLQTNNAGCEILRLIDGINPDDCN